MAGEVREASLFLLDGEVRALGQVEDHLDLSEVTHPSNTSNDCPEHNIINNIGQDIHFVELVDDNLLSNASSNSLRRLGMNLMSKKTSEVIVVYHP